VIVTGIDILDSLDIGVVILDGGHRIQHMNSWIRRFISVPIKDVEGLLIEVLFPNILSGPLPTVIDDVLLSGRSQKLNSSEHESLFPLRQANGDVLHQTICVSRLDGEQSSSCLLQVQDVSAYIGVALALRRAEDQVRARLTELETLYDAAPIGLGLFDQDIRFLRVNEQLADINGASKDDHLGRCAWEIVPSLRSLAEPMFRKVFDTGEPILGIELTGMTSKSPGVLRTWIEDYYPLRGSSGDVIAVGAIVREVTEQKRLEERERLLTRELQHRLKNMFVMVEALASQTARGASSLSDYLDRFSSRIRALAAAQDLLVHRPGAEVVSLAQLAQVALAPFAGPDKRLHIQLGTEIISSEAASDLALALHELATNATKYGAMSGTHGQVFLTGGIEEEEGKQMVCLHWCEMDGPMVSPPAHQGFGSRLLQIIVRQHGGRVTMNWLETGLACRICLPISRAP